MVYVVLQRRKTAAQAAERRRSTGQQLAYIPRDPTMVIPARSRALQYWTGNFHADALIRNIRVTARARETVCRVRAREAEQRRIQAEEAEEARQQEMREKAAEAATTREHNGTPVARDYSLPPTFIRRNQRPGSSRNIWPPPFGRLSLRQQLWWMIPEAKKRQNLCAGAAMGRIGGANRGSGSGGQIGRPEMPTPPLADQLLHQQQNIGTGCRIIWRTGFNGLRTGTGKIIYTSLYSLFCGNFPFYDFSKKWKMILENG